MTRLAVTGATGAMGRTVIETARDRPDVDVVLAVNRGEPAAAVAGVEVEPASSLAAGLDRANVDVLVDFTGPDSSVSYVETAAKAGVGAVVGTTGFDDAQDERLRGAAEDAPVLVAPNFSRGIQALLAVLRGAVERLPTYDVEVTETHHNRKRDAPSGTADRIVAAIEAERPDSTRIHGRHGEAPRNPGEIGVHARRAGDVTGEHEILLAGNAEELRLVHRAESRRVFTAGALDAAEWLANEPPGWYRFADVLEA